MHIRMRSMEFSRRHAFLHHHQHQMKRIHQFVIKEMQIRENMLIR